MDAPNQLRKDDLWAEAYARAAARQQQPPRWSFPLTQQQLCNPLEGFDAMDAEIARLRAALAVYADPENWSVGTGWSGGDEWLGNQHRGWSLAQGALDGSH